MKDLHTIIEASKIVGLTRGALLASIKFKRLNAIKIKNRWMMTLNDLKNYKENRWKRDYPIPKGEITAEKAARKYNVPINTIYGFIYTHQLKCKKRGKAPTTFSETKFLEIVSHKLTIKELRVQHRKMKKAAQEKRAQQRRRITA